MIAVCQIRVLGGAVARIPEDATAYAHRQSRVLVNFAALHMNPQETPIHQEWADSAVGFLPGGNGSAGYVNFFGKVAPAAVHQAYPGKTWQRLTEVKARYDPENFFHNNQNIPPA